MTRLFFLSLLLTLLIAIPGYSQTDTMIIQTGESVKVYLVSDIAGITFSSDFTIGVSEADLAKMNAILGAFTLHQNFPNPFNPSTKILYSIPHKGDAHLRIYNINGKLIDEFHFINQEKGEHIFTWGSKCSDGSVIPSGVYFYQVQFDNSLLTKKMIYVK
jgi:hypothetical protein